MAEEITSHVYDITCGWDDGRRFRVLLFDHDVATLIDTGFEETADKVAQEVNDLGVQLERIIVTHGDGDHTNGLASLSERFDVKVFAPMETTGLDIEPDVRYSNGDTIGRFEAVHTPGHKPDNYSLVDERAGLVVTGDAAYGSDHLGLPPGYLVIPPAWATQDCDLACDSLATLLEYDFDTALVFHGSHVVGEAREKLKQVVHPHEFPDFQ